ncbi:hypothetical protein C1752_00223 [Acaryochloris thomasi RCC1774]|uniref:AAA+ ATPase domain-containing protein n=1 Tax=Acaryochloris thomasi RCC1774 TaxID=1764569 RepID=A0A2W1JNW8_9CYAN|nr:DUF1822 family protein [Acaryochloris thomasi]PZD75023.1 hypothetical protein C1752_00223 [Acaryochloris thomasi RCC1774]
MDVEIALRIIDEAVFDFIERHLSAPEVEIVRGTWVRSTYDEMAETSPFSMNYLKRDVGPKFWKLLSKAWAEDVNKSNLQTVLERRTSNFASKTLARGASAPPHQDWTMSAPLCLPLEGREGELAQLKDWLQAEPSSVVAIQGLPGVGKTGLARQLAENVQSSFEYVVWHSLGQAPVLQRSLEVLSAQLPEVTTSADEALARVLAQCRQYRCLLVLDGVESILQPGQLAGHYRSGYEDYAAFFEQMTVATHRSCLVITTLEVPTSLLMQSQTPSFRYLSLSGLPENDATLLLTQEGLKAKKAWPLLIHQYQGHPLALKMVAQRIQRLFNGDVSGFLAQENVLTGGLESLLSGVFNRLTQIEQELLYTLACASAPLSLVNLESLLPTQGNLLEALGSLQARSLLKTQDQKAVAYFTLAPFVQAFAIADLTRQLREHPTAEHPQPLSLKIPELKLSAEHEPVSLSQWMAGEIEPDWQPLDRLLADTAQLIPTLRSLSSLRDGSSVKRLKYLKLSSEDPQSQVALLVMITPQAGERMLMHVQLQPGGEVAELPPQIHLKLLDESGESLREVQSQQHDSFIQLPSFSGKLGESFGLQIVLGDNCISETFVI